MQDPSKTLLVIGGGAAGMFCAVNAARLHPFLRVVVAEKSGKLLSKVRISGGGRCNLTHASDDIAGMARKYPRGGNFTKKAFHQFFTADTVRWFEERGVPLKTEEDGRMFPLANTSQAVIDCLLREANRYGVEILMNREVKELRQALREAEGVSGVPGVPGVSDVPGVPAAQFRAVFANGEELKADRVCVACGGYPKSSMFDWLRALGHSIEEPLPSLFTFNIKGGASGYTGPNPGGAAGVTGVASASSGAGAPLPITQLMGVSVEEAQVKVSGTKLVEKGPVLITHWGLSGPAVLRLSAWGARELAALQYHFTIIINWIPGMNEQSAIRVLQEQRFERAAQKIMNRNSFGLPARLWEWVAAESGIPPDLRWADLPAVLQNRLAKNLCAQSFTVSGKTTFKEEFVTAGGIRLAEVDVNTSQSRIVPGLFFAGEILDVDGITGGYNFQHAWTSGYIAAAAMFPS